MIKLGEIQRLKVVSLAPVGVYLNVDENSRQNNILLPRNQVPDDISLGDNIEVFVYRDSEDRLIATTKRPKLLLNEFELLEVASISRIGAFLDWGLEKDLFLPFKEQTCKINEGEKYLVSLYIDKSDRLCATMDIYNLLLDKSPYKINDTITGIIYDIKDDMGAFVAVDKKYHGLIPTNELFKKHKVGDSINGRVTKVREDGKLYISTRDKAYKQMDKDAEYLYDYLINNTGFISLNDKSTPEEIKSIMKMSKNAFKRAVGRLLKEGKIELTNDGIKLTK